MSNLELQVGIIKSCNYLGWKEPLEIVWCNSLLKAWLISCPVIISCPCKKKIKKYRYHMQISIMQTSDVQQLMNFSQGDGMGVQLSWVTWICRLYQFFTVRFRLTLYLIKLQHGKYNSNCSTICSLNKQINKISIWESQKVHTQNFLWEN